MKRAQKHKIKQIASSEKKRGKKKSSIYSTKLICNTMFSNKKTNTKPTICKFMWWISCELYQRNTAQCTLDIHEIKYMNVFKSIANIYYEKKTCSMKFSLLNFSFELFACILINDCIRYFSLTLFSLVYI